MAVLSYDEMVSAMVRDYGMPLAKAQAEARRQLGMPAIQPAAAPEPKSRATIALPITIALPWSLLVSDNDKCEAKGEKHMLTSRYRQAKAAIPERARQQLGEIAPTREPVALTARVYVPDNRTHDVCNFAKLVHDALQGVVYVNDSLLWDTRWVRAGVDVDRPRAEITIAAAAA